MQMRKVKFKSFQINMKQEISRKANIYPKGIFRAPVVFQFIVQIFVY